MLKDKQEEMDAQFKKEKEEVWAEQESHKKHKNPTKTHLQTTRETTTRRHCLFAKMVFCRVTLSHDILWLPGITWVWMKQP